MEDLVFIGDWIKDRVLGSGSFGTVVLWKHKATDEKLAIKTCKWSDELTAKHRERWTKEVEMLQHCSNPNIVGTKPLPPDFIKGLEKVNPSKLPILCMEYCSGGDLRQALNKPESCAGLKEAQVRQILSDIHNAMQFLHSNKITHRDLKPENIVMQVTDKPGAPGQKKITYKLIDLGYAKEIDSNSVCASFVGTLQYLAPEIMYSKTYSNSVDYWSFGLLAFEAMCGVRPFLPYKSPVQWMPFVKKKSHDNICVYETFHDQIEYSNEIFIENHISKAFKVLIEQWLRVALEWDPKLRGRDAPSKVTFKIPSEATESPSKVVFFNLLESILSTKIIKIFSVPTVRQLSYTIEDKTLISQLKSWICSDTAIPVQDQILISQMTYTNITDDEVVAKYWSDQNNTMLFLYDRNCLLKSNVEPVVPLAVQRCLGQPNAVYNYKNSQDLYRNALYFVMTQMEAYDSLINGLLVRAESLKHESKQLLLKHNNVDKDIGKLMTQEETIEKIVETGRKHLQHMRDTGTGTNYLGGFEMLFTDKDGISARIDKLQTAWSQLSVRLQSAARRSNEPIQVDLNKFIYKYNFQNVFTNAMKSYIVNKKADFYNKNPDADFGGNQKPCQDIKKISYECLRLSCKILQDIQNQPFILKLFDLSMEFSKISDILNKATENTEKLTKDLAATSEELNNCIWSTLSILACDADSVGDLPYSVVSFQKRDFIIGEAVTNPKIQASKVEEDEQLKSLIEESLKIRQNHKSLSEKFNTQKKIINNAILDFNFLNDK